jgi:hypothetical protein
MKSLSVEVLEILDLGHDASVADVLQAVRLGKQARGILTALEKWSTPGRGFKVTRSPDGRFQATLLEVERRSSGGESLADALAHIAQAASFEDTRMPSVHILYHGRPLCGFSTEVPKDWPDGETWVSRQEKNEATCVECSLLEKELP